MDQLTIDLPRECFLNEDKLPVVLEAEAKARSAEDLYALLETAREPLRQKLLKYGGILFRGYRLTSPQDFSKAIDVLNLGTSLDYIGGDSPRDKVWGHVYTSTEAPPSFKILLHNELSFVNRYPKHIYFCCQIAPSARGETILADARKVYQTVDPEVRNRWEERRLRYISRYFHRSWLLEWINRLARSHKSWTTVFESESKQEVEGICRANGFGFRWRLRDWLEITQERPATIVHPETGDSVWFNQAHLYDFNPRHLGFARWVGATLLYFLPHTRYHDVRHKDGRRIARQDLDHIMDVLDERTIAFPWQQGDFLVLDNVLAMHGRAPFSGPRRILAAMTG
jgi:alpha-ketoglutarate-dependent taurine dioxygenase